MEHTNGSTRGPVAMNGGVKPLNGTLNGRALGPRQRTVQRRRPGLFARLFGIIARLATWYSIFTVLFRCPSSIDLCDETSPRVCKPYFQIKHAVSPHLEPYYDAYAAPYVQLVQPYYDAVDRTVLAPSWAYVSKHGAPRLAQAQALGQAEWQRTIQPQLVKYQTMAKAQYDQALGPHVDRVSTAVGPYYDIARTNALQTYHELLLPTYQYLEPHALQGYGAASLFVTGTAVPATQWAWNKTYVFLDGTVLPHLRVIYVENVEPQLVKIGQRLGRHNNGNVVAKPGAENASVEAPSSSTISSKASSSFIKPTPSISSSSSEAEESSSSIAAPPSSESEAAETPESRARGTEPVSAPEAPEEGESDLRRVARETVAEDLKAWQDKYHKAADEGATEIDRRIEEISKRMIRRQARTMGKSLVEQLQQSVVSGLVQLRRDILNLAGAVQKGSATPQEGEDQIAVVVRRAGLEIKQKAQDIRDWHGQYNTELRAAVTDAAATHFKILASIRDLALQKIGMKWAWMDGITYQDWAKYHLLKDRFDEWEKELEQLIVTHPALTEAENVGQTVEDEGMEMAQSAAKELGRLKQVAAWKIAAKDATDEFDSDAMEKAAAAAQEAVADIVPPEASQSSAAESIINSISEEVSTASVETPLPSLESLVSEASSVVSSATEEISSIVRPPSVSEVASEATEAAKESGASVVAPEPPTEASSVVLEETPIILGNTTEYTAEDGPAPVHLPVDEVAQPSEVAPATSDSTSPATLDATSSVTTSTTSIKSVMFGAAAQSVPSRKPILDSEESSAASFMSSIQTDLPFTISSVASSAYSVAMSHAAKQYSSALKIISDDHKGTPQAVHEQLVASVTSAYSLAVESASSRLNDALSAAGDIHSAASSKIMPQPTKAPSFEWAHVESVAAERLSQGRAWAEEQYESAKVAIGLATPTPSSSTERLLENAKYNYYAGLGMAQARYSEFMGAASSAFSSLTATPTPTDFVGTVSSVASAASASGASAASVVGDSISSAASAAGENVSAAAASAASAASAVGDNMSSMAGAGYENVASAANAGYESAASAAGAAGGAISENWEAMLTQISVQIYGAPTPTPWYQSIASAASEYGASATEAIGGGASTVTSAAGTYADEAAKRLSVYSDDAAKQYSAVSSLLSELIVGKEPTFSESVYSRLSAAYVTGVASASSIASAASDGAAAAGQKVASAASEATEAVKETVQHVKDEL